MRVNAITHSMFTVPPDKIPDRPELPRNTIIKEDSFIYSRLTASNEITEDKSIFLCIYKILNSKENALQSKQLKP